MNIATTSMAPPIGTQEADAAERPCTAQAKEENTRQLAAMSEDANEGHIAEHIRGLVAVTMAHPSIDATVTTRNNAKQWQDRALGAADGVQQRVPAVV